MHGLHWPKACAEASASAEVWEFAPFRWPFTPAHALAILPCCSSDVDAAWPSRLPGPLPAAEELDRGTPGPRWRGCGGAPICSAGPSSPLAELSAAASQTRHLRRSRVLLDGWTCLIFLLLWGSWQYSQDAPFLQTPW